MNIVKRIVDEAWKIYLNGNDNCITPFKECVEQAAEKVLREFEIPERVQYIGIPTLREEDIDKEYDRWKSWWHKAIFGDHIVDDKKIVDVGMMCAEGYAEEFGKAIDKTLTDANKPTEPKPEFPEKFLSPYGERTPSNSELAERINALIDHLRAKQ